MEVDGSFDNFPEFNGVMIKGEPAVNLQGRKSNSSGLYYGVHHKNLATWEENQP